MEGVGDGTLQLGIFRRDPTFQEPPDAVWCSHRGRVLVRQQRDLPTSSVPDAPDVGRRARRIAILDAVLPEGGDRALQKRVHDQPTLVEAEVLDG
jgi:hypothetical protein